MAKRDEIRARRRALALAWLQYLLWAGVLAGGYVGVTYVFNRSASEVAKVKNRKESEYYISSDQKLSMRVVNDNGELSMVISGDEAHLSQDQRKAIFKGAHAVYYEGGKPSITMQAGQITYDTQTEDFLLENGLSIDTSDGMKVTSDEVQWRQAKNASRSPGPGTKVPAFSFPKGVKVVSSDGNVLQASYMQADRNLQYMEFVGNVHGEVSALNDTGFITQRKLTDVDQLKLKDIQKLSFDAEQVIYDKQNQVMLATSRYYDKAFKVIDPDGHEVKVDTYQKQPEQVTFAKEKITIKCNHLEAHVAQKWVTCLGNIDMLVPPDQPKPGDDKALRVMKQYPTHIATDSAEYFWGRDYIVTHSPSRVESEDRLAQCDRLTYWGDKKMVLLDGDVTMVNGSGEWMVKDELIEVDNHDMRRAVTSYTELYGDRAVVYLNNNDFIASGSVRIRQDERETSADTIVYQNDIKRITATGNVKFRDKDGQTFLCGALVYHKNSDYMEVQGGAVADIRLPAKFANDINGAIANAREKPAPPKVTDPPVPAELPAHNPNEHSHWTGLAPPATRTSSRMRRPSMCRGRTAPRASRALPGRSLPRRSRLPRRLRRRRPVRPRRTPLRPALRRTTAARPTRAG
jgi:lipopolysaccharide export system protein LptA